MARKPILMSFVLISFFFKKRKKPSNQVNTFIPNSIGNNDEFNSPFHYYVRPFISFWTEPELTFEEVNEYKSTPSINVENHLRYLMQKLVKTWLNHDKEWFDKSEIFEILKQDLVAMLDSTYVSKNRLSKHWCFVFFFSSPYEKSFFTFS